MKTISSSLLAALSSEIVSPSSNLVIQKSTIFSNDLSDSHPSWATDTNEISGDIIPQDVFIFTAGESTNSASVSVVSGKLEFCVYGSSASLRGTLSGDDISVPNGYRPGVSYPYVYYIDAVSSEIKRGEISSTGLGGVGDTVENDEVVATGISSGSLFCIAPNKVVRVFLDEGGICASIYQKTSSWALVSTWSNRFVFPKLLASSPALTVTCCAAELNGKVFVYASDWYTGQIVGVSYGRCWSETFVCVPADLSVNRICNCVVANSRIHLAVQFSRTEEFASSTKNLVLRSTDGAIFATDRFCLFSNLGWRFLICVDNNYIYGHASNRQILSPVTYFLSSTNPAEVVISHDDIISVSGSQSGSVTIKIKNGQFQYSNQDVIRLWSRVLVNIGYLTPAGEETSEFMDGVIQASTVDIADARSSFTLSVVPRPLWAIETMGFPVYLEVQGKDAVATKFKDSSDFYVTPQSGRIVDKLSFDVWATEGYASPPIEAVDVLRNGGVQPWETSEAHSLGFGFSDISNKCVLASDPQIASDVVVKIYCWSRPIDETDGDCDVIKPILVIKDKTSGRETTLSSPTLSSSYDVPAKTWPSVASGSYPLVWEFPVSGEVEIGDTISSVFFSASSANGTVFFIEHVEITGVVAVKSDNSNTPWTHSGEDAVYTAKSPRLTFSQEAIGDTPVNMWAHESIVPSPSLDVLLERADYVPANSVCKRYGSFENTYMLQATVAAGDVIPSGSIVLGVSVTILDQSRWSSCRDRYARLVLDGSLSDDKADPDHQWPNPYETRIFGGDNDLWGYSEITPEQVNAGLLRFEIQAQHNDGFLFIDSFAQIDNIVITIYYNSAGSKTETGKLTIPNYGRPYLMTAVAPHNAFNFQQTASFVHTPGANPAGSGCWAGLMAFSENALDYIVGRYDFAAGVLDISSIRNGAHINLASVSYQAYPADSITLMFRHQDGEFSLWVKEGTRFFRRLSYRWLLADGVLFPGTDIDMMHIGLYGNKGGISFEITSFDPSSSEVIMPLPGQDFSFWNSLPDAGTVAIDGKTYTYAKPSETFMEPRGAYQARNTTDWLRLGMGSGIAIELTMFDWNGVESSLADYYMASDNGHSWKISSTLWQCWITTLGVVKWLRNRSRHYGPTVDGNFVGMANRMYIGSGLVVSEQAEESTLHANGSLCTLNSTDAIDVVFFSASTNGDITIENLLTRFCRMAGADAGFPGNAVHASFPIGETREQLE